MAIFNIFARRRAAQGDDIEHRPFVEGMNGFGAPLAIVYGAKRAAPGISENAALYPYLTYLSPRWTPIGGGIPNKRDIGTTPPAYSRQGVLVAQVGSPGILAGAFVSGPLTNVSSQVSTQDIPSSGSFLLPTV
jgi:hypothetical protein